LDFREAILELLLYDVRIDNVADTLEVEGDDSNEHPCIKQWMDLDDKNNYRTTDQDINTFITRTNTANLTTFDGGEYHARWTDASLTRLKYLINEERGSLYTAWIRNMVQANRQAQWIAAQKGKFGLAPTGAEGTAICVVLGSEVPLLLRLDPSDGKYRFVGECYLHGFMDGEALVEARREAMGADELDGGDTSWLNRLHEESLSFPVQEVLYQVASGRSASRMTEHDSRPR
jgi:hypothetical protein